MKDIHQIGFTEEELTICKTELELLLASSTSNVIRTYPNVFQLKEMIKDILRDMDSYDD